MRQADDESGITLVEIMLSLLVLGVVLTAFFTVVTGGLQSLSESRARQMSSQLSTEVIEELRRLSPSEIAMNDDDTSGDYFDTSTVSCTDSGGTTHSGWFDPDGDGPLDCEEIETAMQGAITSKAPYQTTTTEGITVTTIATNAEPTNSDVPDDTVRVTVVTEYSLPAGTEEIRRSALFSEVSRG